MSIVHDRSECQPKACKSIDQMDRESAQRALDQAADYTCRFGLDAAGQFCIIVEGPRDTYHVHEDGRCDCPQFTGRLAGTVARCKHWYISLLWLDGWMESEGDFPADLPDTIATWKPLRRPEPLVVTYAQPEESTRREKVRMQMEQDFPVELYG